MLKTFRITALLEGISYLSLFAFTMPLKYWAEIGEPNTWVGYVHGGLFVFYLVLLTLLTYQKKWGAKKFVVWFVASLLPFGTFYADKKYFGVTSKTGN